MEKNHFRVDIDIKEQKIFVSLTTDKYNNTNITILIKDIENKNEIHKDNIITNKDFNYWFIPTDFDKFKGFIVEIYHHNNKLFEETNRLKSTIYGNPIKKQCLFIADLGGVFDSFFVEPLIRKISKTFEQKIIVFTYYPQLFINHPCIDRLIKVDTFHALNEIVKNVPVEFLNEEIYNIRYVMRWERDPFGYIPHWAGIDLRQFADFQYGITLKSDELNYHFYPDDFIPIDGLPEKYVVINPAKTGADRTWSIENWQKLINVLNDNNINVVSIGKETPAKNFDKGETSFFGIKIKKGLDLCGDERQSSLSQVWHIINKSDMIISFDNGLFTLGGSTDTFLLQLGGAGDPIFHQPYRNESQYYKYKYVCGDCKIGCLSDPKYTVRFQGFFGNKKGPEHLGFCFMGYPDYKCHPKPESVIEEALKILL